MFVDQNHDELFFQGWENYFLKSISQDSGILRILPTLRTSRDVILRASVFQLMVGLTSPKIAVFITCGKYIL